jgi:signal transduction histidine kinase/ABC-type uncharacterized transport system substrate-binding protein
MCKFPFKKRSVNSTSCLHASRNHRDRVQSGVYGLLQVVSLWLGIFFLLQSPASAQVKEVRRVLILDDLGIISSPGFSEVDQAVFLGLQKSPYQIELYHESLELTLFPDESSQRRFRQSFIEKYSARRPDVIITAGSASLKFIAELQEKFLRETPVVFCAILGETPDLLKPDMHFTGVLGKLHPEETLRTALHLLPGTKHVVVVGGVGKFDEPFEAAAKEGFHKYETTLEFEYLTDLAMPALLDRLGHLPSNTIVYHTAITQDAAGERFIDSAQSVPLVASAANAPVFVMDDVDLRGGTMGGDLVNWADDGSVAAGMAVRVLNGEKPENIPIVTSRNAYMFDWHALQHWRLRESDLPAGSIVMFRDPSVWERTKWFWIGALLVILVLSALATYLQYSRMQLRVARDAQTQLSRLLIGGQEKERSRLATELHDDFSQRVALLAVQMETVGDTISTSPQEAEKQLHELMNATSEIGADLHTLSHRLHSSTLESLGLVPALNALCKEISSQQGIEVDFRSDSVPRSVGQDTALCVFRIVQEGLRNVKKYSGVQKAEVELRRASDKLHLTVHDEGRGFDLSNLQHNEGLGLRSMRERAYLVGGQFQIHSAVGKGTTIEVCVPLQSTPA